MISFIPALLVKATVIFAAGFVVVAAMRTVSSSIRHLVLLATLVCGLTLPAMMLVSPRWDVRVLPRSSASLIPSVTPQVAAADPSEPPASLAAVMTVHAGGVSPPVAAVDNHRPAFLNSESTPALSWAIGLIAVLSWLAIGRLRLRKIVGEAWPLRDADWRRVLEQARAEADVTREVRLFTSAVVTTPLTWGTIQPVILLPEEALDWEDDHRRVVLRHEMAHISRADSLSQLIAGFVCALYWFHPMVWLLERRLRAECERACDDRVVTLGTPAADYASHLLEVARSARSIGAPGFLSVAMARPSQLEGRLLAVLNESRERMAASRTARLIAIAISVLVMLPLAAFRPVERTSASAPAPATAPQSQRPRESPRTATIINGNSYSTENLSRKPGRRFDTTFTISAPLRSGGTLYIDLKTGGSITITSWDRPEVFVNARLGGRSWGDTRVTLEPSDGNATLTSDFIRDSRNQSTSHDFDIKLPREVKVRIRSAGGDIDISNTSGDFSGQTGGGEINIRKVNGRVDLSTGGGEVRVQDSNIDGNVSTGGGIVHIVRVNGHFNGSSGSGPVIHEGTGVGKGFGYGVGEGAATMATVNGDTTGIAIATGGPITMASAGGSLKLPFAPNGARVTTGGGKITIGPSGGAVYAETGGGDIELGPARGSVEAHTGAGSVEIDFRGNGSVDVTSGSGRVVINVPDDLNANLDLETAYTDNFRGKTRIISDWPLNVTETSNWDTSHGTPRRYVRVRQQIGRGGPLIKVNTVNGDIVLRKGS
jgi:beta-lactamase regulating signal transducer with metallopeptidase domain